MPQFIFLNISFFAWFLNLPLYMDTIFTTTASLVSPVAGVVATFWEHGISVLSGSTDVSAMLYTNRQDFGNGSGLFCLERFVKSYFFD